MSDLLIVWFPADTVTIRKYCRPIFVLQIKTPMKQLTLTVSLVLLTVTLFAQTPCKPHPVFTPLANHSIRSCNEKEFDQLRLYQEDKAKGRVEITKQGHFSEIDYKFDGEWDKRPSTIQIIENYTNAVKKAAGDVLSKGQSNLYAKMKKGDATYWIHVSTDGSGDYWVTTILEEKMRQDVSVISAEEIRNTMNEDGRVAFYGIYFDTDKSTLKPESDPALAEMAKYLKENAAINVYIVGHTDNTGDFAHNSTLSKSRAEAVVNELAGKYQIAKTRLIAQGVGPLSPVASNKTEEGKGKNRRVEMVLR
jgi:outer membrane protein OmpA-like peptidoglycan-associated protein